MQDGQLSNTPFEDLLSRSNFKAPSKPSLQVFAESGTEPVNPALVLDQLQKKINSTPDYALGPQSPVTFSPFQVDITGRYNWQRIGADNEDLYGQGQSWGDKMVNGVIKGLNLAGTTFLAGTVGTLVGLSDVISGKGLNSLFNNDFTNTIEKWNKKVENYMPNYYTKAERDAHWYEPKNLFTANFLFDKFIKNLGFSLGAIYSGAAVAKGLKAIPAIKSLFTGEKAAATLLNIEKTIGAIPATERTAHMLSTIRQASDAAIFAKTVGTRAERLTVGLLGASTEAGIEALQGLNEYRSHLIGEYTTSTGAAPIGAELDKINDYAEQLGNARYMMNVGLLSATNYIMLPKILGTSYKTSRGLANQEINAISKTADGKWATRFSQLPKAGKLLSRTGAVGGLFFSPTEGFEELSQFAIERGVQDYYNKAYHGDGANWLSSISQGYHDAISSDEGMEQFLIGALSGGIQQSGIISRKGFGKSGNIKESGWTGQGGERAKNTTDLLTALNDPKRQLNFKSEGWLKEMAEAASRGINLQVEGEARIRQGDILEAKDNEADYIINYLTPRIKYGRYDLVKDDIEEFRHTAATEEGLEQLKQQGVANENDTTATFNQRLINFEKHADNINSLYQSLNLTYGGMVDKEGNKVYTDSIINKMVYAASKVSDYDQRIPELSQGLITEGVALPGVISSVLQETPDETVVKEALTTIDGLDVLADKKEDLKRDLRDVLEMSKRRKLFIDEYAKLKASPQSFTDTVTPTSTSTTTDPPKKITIKTKNGDKELEVGVEYYLGQVVEEDKKGNQVFRFPKLTILGENEDGTIKIKGSTGIIKDISKAELESYKLGKVSDTDKNKKAKFYMEHVNDVFEFNFGKDKKQIGRLWYYPEMNKMFFVYKNKRGKQKEIEVTGDQFVPRKGHNQPMIRTIRTLTKAEQENLEAMAADKDARIQAKRESRLKIVTELIQDSYNSLEAITNKMAKKYEELNEVQKKLDEIDTKIRGGGMTKKQSFKAATKAAIKQANLLVQLRDSIVNEIRELETQQEETEFNISYFEDLGQNIDELPTDSKEFMEEINDQVLDLQILHEETGKQINYLSSIIKNIEKALKDAVDFAFNLINKFESKYPNIPIAPEALRQFLNKDMEFKGVWPDYQSYLSANPNLMDDLREFDRELAEIDDLDVTPNERSIKELSDNITELNEKLKQFEKEIGAKQAILDKFDQIAKAFKAEQAAKARYSQDKALHDALFKAQSDIQEQPTDTSSPAEVEKLEKADKEATKKQDLSVIVEGETLPLYPVSTAFTTREIDPEFENKPHLLREEAFLNNYANGTLVNDEGNEITKDNLRVLVIHQGNQAQFGLEGLVEQRNTNPATQPSTIVYLYVLKAEGQWVVINEKGDTIGTLDIDFNPAIPIDINQTVTSVAKSSTNIAQKQENYTNKQKLDVTAVAKAWEEQRQKLLESTEPQILEIRGVSRGVRQVTNSSDRNPIVPTLTTEEVAETNGIIKVSTTDTITGPNETVRYKAGRPYFQLGDNIIFLNNRTLNKQEADTVFLVLKELAARFQESLQNKTPQLDKPLLDWINSVLYWYSPKGGQKVHNHQVYIKHGQLFISGNNTEIYFAPEQLEANREPIISTFLMGNQAGRGTYHNVSHKALSTPGEYVSYYTEDGKTLKTKTYPSYQQYLLDNQVVTTNVRPQMTPTDSNIRGRYAIIDIDLNLPKPENKPAAAPVVNPTSTEGAMSDFEKAMLIVEENRKRNEAAASGQPQQEAPPKPAAESPLKASVQTGDLPKGTTVQASIKIEDLLGKGYTGQVENDDDAAFRRASEEDIKNVTPENWAKVELWLKRNLPNVPVERVKHLLKVTGGGWAWGKFSSKGITLFENAQEGTAYHEAFEAVWGLFTTQVERDGVVSDMRKRTGEFFDVISRTNQSYKTATQEQLKEVLADEFADFVQREGKPSEKAKGQPWIVRIFKGLYDFLKSLFEPQQTNIDRLFEQINTGWYATRPVNIPENTQDQYSRVAEFSHQITRELMEDITSRLLNNFFGPKATLSVANLSDNKSIPMGVYYDKIKTLIINTYIAKAFEARKNGDESSYENYATLASNIDRDWKDIIKLNEEYLKKFGIARVSKEDSVPEKVLQTATQADLSEDEETDEDGETGTFEQENKSQLEYDKDIFTISGKANASAGIRFLLSTLRDAYAVRQDRNDASILPEIEFRKSSIGGYKFLSYARVFNQLANALVNTNGIEKILNKLVKHGKQNPPIVGLIKRLKINTSDGKINYSSLSYDDWRILLDFVKTMSKQNPSAFIYKQDGAEAHFFPGDKRSGIEVIKQAFTKVVKNNKDLFTYDKKSKMYVVNKTFFNKHKAPTTDEEFVKFVNDIGFRQVEGEVVSLPGLRSLTKNEKQRFKTAVSQVYAQLKKQEPVYDTQNKALQLASPLNTIAETIVTMTKDDGVNTFLNILRKPVQTVVLNNPLSTFFNNFNSASGIGELLANEQGLAEGFSHHSITLQAGGRFFTKSGARTEERIEIGYFDGLMKPGRSRQSAKLSLINRRLSTFNLNLRGWYIPITNGDKKTEWMLSMGNNISYKEIVSGAGWNRVYSIFQNYLKAEINTAKEDDGKNLVALKKQGRGGNLRFFLDILPAPLVKQAQNTIQNLESADEFVALHEEEINKAVKKFLTKEASKTRSEFHQYGVIQEGETHYTVQGIDSSFLHEVNDKGANVFSEKQIDELMLYRTVNQVINNIEIHKIFIGDPALITDPAKRIPGAMGGVNQSVYGSQEFNDIFSPLLNRVDVKDTSVAVKPTDYGYTHLSEDVPMTLYSDVTVKGRVEGSKDYDNTNETDGASKMTLPAYRELKTRSAEWTDQQEGQYQYQMAFFRDRAFKQWGYKYSSKELEKHDQDLLSKSQPEDGVFEILKPKAWAQNSNSNYRDVVYLKTSTQPLIPTAIQGTNDEKLLKKMLDEGIKIAAFESAIKTGIRSLTSFYDKDGGFNQAKYPKDGILRPTWKDLGIQVETQFSQGKTTTTFGSQLSTMSTLNLLSGGVPDGFKQGEWDAMTEEQKLKASPVYAEVRRNDNILRELTNNGYKTLLKKLGITQTADGYDIKDHEALVSYLIEQSRDMDDNTRAALQIDELTRQLRTPLEAIPTYTQLKAVLYSIVDKNVASPKVSGVGLVQMPSTGTESEARTTLVGNSTYKFYTREEPWIEISLPAWFRDKLVQHYTKRKLPIPTEAELLKLINDSDILEGIGFRIPTQELNSVEVFKIKSFLPKVMGNAVIVPSEITQKAGSDFDIDKLTTYLKNITINSNGTISKISSFESEQAASTFFSEEFDRRLEESKKRLQKAKATVYFKQSKAQDYAEGLLSDEQIEKYDDFLNEMFEEFDKPEDAGEYFMKVLEGMGAREKRLNDDVLQARLKEDYIERNVRKSIENAYYESLRTILQLPQNFDRLTKINTTKELENIKNTLNKALYTEEEIKEFSINTGEKPALSYLSTLSPNSLDEIRHNLITGKDGVGIAAAAQKSNSIMQRSAVVIDFKRASLLAHLDPTRVEYMGDGEIRFPHNTINGKPTISGSKTKNGKQYVSDIISQYINGFVDIVKNTFIIEMGINTRTAGTFLFMDRLGNDTAHTTYFMNQPIIRQYLKLLDKSGIGGIRSKTIAKEIWNKWGQDTYEQKDKLPNTKQLLENIEMYRDKNRDFNKLPIDFIQEQAKIFNEFLKYQEMAGDLFALMQGITWDTAHMSDPEQFLLKDVKLWKANNTIFTPASEILSNVFIGTVRDNLIKSRNAIGSFISLEHPKVREILDEVKMRFIDPSFFPSADDYSKMAHRVNNAFINYIMQVKGQLKDKVMKNVLLDEVTSAAHLLEQLKETTPKDSPIYSILKQFSVERRGPTEDHVKAILFRKSGTDKYDRDNDIDNFRLLKENAHTKALYGKLVRAAMLQSGTQYSPIAFANLIPNEDYSIVLSQPISNLPTYTDLDSFLTTNSFVRNSWATNGIIPTAKISKSQIKDTTDEGGNLWVGPFAAPKQFASFPRGSIMTSIRNHGKYVKYQPFSTEGNFGYDPYEHRLIFKKTAFEQNDPSIVKTYLYEVVTKEDGTPLTYEVKGKTGDMLTIYVYKSINAWGDGMYAQEYFDTNRPSQIDNNTFRIDESQINDASILKAFAKPIKSFAQFKEDLPKENCN